MPKFNPKTLPEVQLPRVSRTFTDPLQPGVEVEIAFRAMDPLQAVDATNEAQKMVRTFVTGLPATAKEPARAPCLYPAPVGDRDLKLNETICFSVCNMAGMSAAAADDPQDAYTADEFLAFLVTMPNAMDAMMAFANEVNAMEGGEAAPFSSPEAGAPSSGPASDASASPTPT
jgi:hypothetical protein